MDVVAQIFVLILVAMMVPQTYQAILFRKLPVRFYPQVDGLLVNVTVSDPGDCATQAAAEENGNIIIYYQDTGNCQVYQYGISYALTSDDVQQTGNLSYTYYIRTKAGCGCATAPEAERMIIDITYFEGPCMPKYNINYQKPANYCIGETSDQNVTLRIGNRYSYWRTGATYNGTVYFMTRGQATQMTKFTCPGSSYQSIRLVYNNIWYCFSSTPENATDITPFQQNTCSDLITNGYGARPIVPIAYGMIYVLTSSKAITGIVSYDGGSTYVYNDNTQINITLNWRSGYPTGKPMVAVYTDLTLYDLDENSTGRMNCMGPVAAR